MIPSKPPGDFAMYDISDSTFEKEVLKSDIPVFVMFYNPSCGACHDLMDTIQSIGIAFKGRLKFVKMDAARNPAYSLSYVQQGMPHSVIIHKGEVVRDPRIMDGQSVWIGSAEHVHTFLGWINNVLNIISENW
jgi:thioredoxin 1